jgi:hypothetical protein
MPSELSIPEPILATLEAELTKTPPPYGVIYDSDDEGRVVSCRVYPHLGFHAVLWQKCAFVVLPISRVPLPSTLEASTGGFRR